MDSLFVDILTKKSNLIITNINIKEYFYINFANLGCYCINLNDAFYVKINKHYVPYLN